MVEKWEKKLKASQNVLAVLHPFGKTTTQVEVSIQKVNVKAILDTGSPVNAVLSKLMNKLKLAPDLNYNQIYGTAGLISTKAIGAYSALPMRFRKMLIAAPAVVLENDSYNLLIGTQFLREYNGIINLKEGYLSLLSYDVPLVLEEPVKLPGKRLKSCVMEYSTGIFNLKFRTHSSNMKTPPPSCSANKGVLLLALHATTIPPGSQVLVDLQVSYELPEKTFLELFSPESLGQKEPHLCPGILDSSYTDPVILLLSNLTADPIQVS